MRSALDGGNADTTHRFLKLVAEFDAREGWARHGCASCAHWLNWQCGIGPVAAREKVRVARALDGLPLLSEAFAGGELSYSKVRAVTRVATPDNEAALLDAALHGTASHVEKLVRRYRTTERLEVAFLANEQHDARFVRYRYDETGSLVLQACLPAELGAMVVEALKAAEQALSETPPSDELVSDKPVSAETFPRTLESHCRWRRCTTSAASPSIRTPPARAGRVSRWTTRSPSGGCGPCAVRPSPSPSPVVVRPGCRAR